MSVVAPALPTVSLVDLVDLVDLDGDRRQIASGAVRTRRRARGTMHAVEPAAPATDRPRDAVADALAGAARGDEAAFAGFYDAVAPVVYGTVLRVVRNPAMAEEVTQDVFVELWRQAPSFDPDRGSPTSWAATIAHRRAVDRVRSEESARAREDADARRSPRQQESVADIVIDRDERSAVASALDQLSDLQREAVALAYYGGHTYREVAAILDVPEGTVKTRIRDGLTRLRDIMDVTR